MQESSVRKRTVETLNSGRLRARQQAGGDVSIYDYHVLKRLGLSDNRISQLLPCFQTASFAADQIVLAKGATLHPCFHIISGLVSASVPGKNGEHAPIDIYGPGSWFGEATIFNHHPSSLEFICLTPTRLISLPHAATLSAFENEPQFARYIAHLIAWRDRHHSELLSLTRLGNPTLRVVLGLAMFAESINNGSSHLPVVAHRSQDKLDIPLKQSLLASLCGVSRGVFSEHIQQLAAANWLQVNYSTITLTNLSTWASFSLQCRAARAMDAKPSITKLLALMQAAAAACPSPHPHFTSEFSCSSSNA
jgi:CRP/FNR family cyclic AMP-dependent transcriptional regulator